MGVNYPQVYLRFCATERQNYNGYRPTHVFGVNFSTVPHQHSLVILSPQNSRWRPATGSRFSLVFVASLEFLCIPISRWRGGVTGRALDLRSIGCRFKCQCLFWFKQEGQHPLTGQRAPPISGGT